MSKKFVIIGQNDEYQQWAETINAMDAQDAVDTVIQSRPIAYNTIESVFEVKHTYNVKQKIVVLGKS